MYQWQDEFQEVKDQMEKLAKGTPPPTGSIRESFYFYEPNKKKARKMQALWETILLWSGYDGYFTVKEIAFILHTRPKTIENRIQKFKKLYPEAYEKVLEDRGAIGRCNTRLQKTSIEPVEFKEGVHDSYIVEKF